MALMFAIRLERPNRPVMAPMSHASSSLNPCSRSASKSASPTPAESLQTYIAKSSIAFWRGVMSALR